MATLVLGWLDASGAGCRAVDAAAASAKAAFAEGGETPWATTAQAPEGGRVFASLRTPAATTRESNEAALAVREMLKGDDKVLLVLAARMGARTKPLRFECGAEAGAIEKEDAADVARAMQEPTLAAAAHVLRSAGVSATAIVVPGYAPARGATCDPDAVDALSALVHAELGVPQGTPAAGAAEFTYAMPVRLGVNYGDSAETMYR